MRFPVLLFLFLTLFSIASHAQQALTLTTADGVTIYEDRYAASGAPKATILTFHQAESNRGEYAPIAARLVEAGFDVVAIDQRSGGNRFARVNESVSKLGHSAPYFEALPDLEAALAHARKTRPDRPVILWGSSYSASLVFLFAAQHPDDVAAILAFSPGEYFGAEHSVAARRR